MTDHTPPLGPLPEPRSMSMLASSADLRYTADDMRAYALQERAAVMAALQEADTIMGHDDAETEWRDKWAHLWGPA